MRNTTILGSLMGAVLLVLLLPVGTSAQFYRDRYYDRDQNDRFERMQLRNALARLDNSSGRLQSDLRLTSQRRIFGIFQFSTVDTSALAQIRDFRRAVWQLRNSSDNGRTLNGSVDEAQVVLERGVQLDRYLRLRSGSAAVDADLSDLRSALHVIADTYDLRIPY